MIYNMRYYIITLMLVCEPSYADILLNVMIIMLYVMELRWSRSVSVIKGDYNVPINEQQSIVQSLEQRVLI